MIDKNRSRVRFRPFYKVDPTSQWEEGQVATLVEVGGEVMVKKYEAQSGEIPLGIFWFPKAQSLTRVSLETAVLSGTTPTNLKYANIVSNSVRVTDVAGTTVYVEGTDYTINYTNGTIARIGPGSIPDGATVIVRYRYNILASELARMPQRFERVPDATLGSGTITVAEGPAEIYTDQYDTSVGYSVNAALYANADGRITTTSGGPQIGKVIAPPTLGYALLGFALKPVIL
jgi:hypothetical protein